MGRAAVVARVRRAVAGVVAAIVLLSFVPGTIADAAPISATAAAGAEASGAGTAPGYDISWPQCGSAYPSNPAFGIVGVNDGIVFSANPCLASEIAWAGGASGSLYANTGNPGPGLSSHWPSGQTSPQVCSASTPDTASCAYDYGWNAAADSYSDAVSAFASLALAGAPSGSPWWLDVETSNSWRSDTSLNVAALSGAVDSLRSAGVTSIGFYSTAYQWGVITGGTTVFAAYPSWVAGASTASGATAACAGSGFTGGAVTLAQYASGGFDADLLCSRTTVSPDFSMSASPSSITVSRGGTAAYGVTIAGSNGFSGSVALAVLGLPAGTTAAFSPNPATASSTLTVHTTASTPKGTFTLTISGSSGSLTHSASVQLRVRR